MGIVRTLQVLASTLILGTIVLLIAKGHSVLAVALLSASHAALLWAASTALSYLNRMTQAIEWTALRNTETPNVLAQVAQGAQPRRTLSKEGGIVDGRSG